MKDDIFQLLIMANVTDPVTSSRLHTTGLQDQDKDQDTKTKIIKIMK